MQLKLFFIPHTCNRQESRRIPGWSEFVQPLRDKAPFWHQLWLDCDRPETAADSLRRTRAACHYAIRRVKADENCIVRERIAADAFLQNDERSLISGQK
jgi:hypothetical protein